MEALAQAISAASGTMLVQLAVENPKGELLPGAFATVRFDRPRRPRRRGDAAGRPDHGRQDGAQVAVLDAGNRVRIRKVTIARDLGNVIELGAGVTAGDRIIDSPPDGWRMAMW